VGEGVGHVRCFGVGRWEEKREGTQQQ
jgi:hypothetical protein